MSFFDFGTEQTGNFEQSTGGDFAPIPKNTVVKVIAENVKWSQFDPDPEYIEIQWSVVDGEYKNRKIFQKLKTQDADPQKAKKAMLMLGAINHNAKGNLHALVSKPTDAELCSALTFKPMFLKLGVWEMDVNSEKKSGNWVVAVSATQGNTPAPTAPTAGGGYGNAQPSNNCDDSDLPF